MKSPITGKEMQLLTQLSSLSFRKESFEIMYHHYYCKDSGEYFTDDALDELNIQQVYHQYRAKHHIPFPEEIKQIREQYKISATKMSEILGLGVNTYRQYESGEMPTTANARLIQMAADPQKFIDMIVLCDTLDDDSKKRYLTRTMQLLDNSKSDTQAGIINYLVGNHSPDIYSGFKKASLEKFTEMVVYFALQLQPFKTKMNKLLFYSDFLMFKENCFSISGVKYRAIDRGPVPQNYQSIFEYLTNENIIDINYNIFPKGYVGEQFEIKNGRKFNPDLFTEKELNVLSRVAITFKETSTNDLVDKSHNEEAWILNKKDKKVISYQTAFLLTGI